MVDRRRHVIPYKDIDPRLYFGDQGLVTQSFVEANIKRGTQFYIEQEFTMNQSAVNYRFKTGKFPVIIKFVLLDVDDRVTFKIVEAPTGISGGTDISSEIRNYNRIDPQDNFCIFTSDPSFTAGTGDNILTKTTPVSATAKSVAANPTNQLGIEYLLVPDMEHSIEFSTSVSSPSFRTWWHMSFYQGELSDDIL